MKISTYIDNHFVEVKDTYFSKVSNGITFINENRIFKIDIVSVGGKRKRDDDDDMKTFEKEHKKVLDEYKKLQEKFNKMREIGELIIEKSKSVSKSLKETKMELLSARVQNEQYLLEKNLAMEACSAMQRQIDELKVKNVRM